MGRLIANGRILDCNADEFERIRSTFLSESHFHRKTFDEIWQRNVGDTLTANLHQDYGQPPSTQIIEGVKRRRS